MSVSLKWHETDFAISHVSPHDYLIVFAELWSFFWDDLSLTQ